jgi:hypothetical protein
MEFQHVSTILQDLSLASVLIYLFRKRVFELLGFVEDPAADATLKSPSIDPSTPQGKQNRRKLLRAWVELGSWISDFKRVNGK